MSRYPIAGRSTLGAALFAALLSGTTLAAGADAPLPPEFDALLQRARALAAAPHRPAEQAMPPALARMTYDDYHAIAWRDEASLWIDTGSRFRAQFFHPGYLFPTPVAMTVVDGGTARPFSFSPSLYRYARHLDLGEIPDDLGFAGVRLTHPLNRADKWDEVIAFLGASYFRGVGRGQHYGLSARGLAIDTAIDRPEEFPQFVAFTLVRPADGASTAQLGALLDSPAVAGAYWFEVTPGDDTVATVTAELFFRHGVGKVGLAPLTSMFWRGEGDPRAKGDLRPEVHDSDGLAVHAGSGEWIWRPLHNPVHLHTSRLMTHDPRGFGLLQRDRQPLSYSDTVVEMETRPSAWIEPLGTWGPGAVELVEIPTKYEYFDNIVAYWVPAEPIAAGTHLKLRYRLSFGGETRCTPPGSHATATRRHAVSPTRTQVRIDWSPIADEPGNTAPIEAVVTGTGARLGPPRIERHRRTGGATVRFDVDDIVAGRSIDLRVYLKRGDEALSETWSMAWRP